MTEVRRVKMKFGDAEFEADVPEDRVQPMYDRFICSLERRSRMPCRTLNGGVKTLASTLASISAANISADARERFISPTTPSESFDTKMLGPLFDLCDDGLVLLKVPPKGVETGAEALLLILYGYLRLKNEDGVLATQLRRAAEHSGISIHWPAYELAPYHRFVNRVGQGKGSAYSLNDQGLTMAQEITSKMLGAVLIQVQPQIFE